MPKETYIPKPTIPFVIGQSIHQSLVAGQQSSLLLSAGRWMLSPRSLLPYVTVNIPTIGGREFTWGQAIEIPEGAQGTVVNTSFHTGDAIFDAIGTGQGTASLLPAGIAIPAVFTQDASLAFYGTPPFDARRARRVYLCMGLSGYGPGGPLPITVIHLGIRRGTFLLPPPGGFAAANGGLLADNITVAGYKKMIPLGYGSDENREVGGANSLPELRPMCLFDALFVRVATAVFEAQFITGHGGTNFGDPYFYAEY